MSEFFDMMSRYKSNLQFSNIFRFVPEFSGATYFAKGFAGDIFCFSIMATQANQPDSLDRIAAWFGDFSNVAVRTRFERVNAHLENTGCNLWAEAKRSEASLAR